MKFICFATAALAAQLKAGAKTETTTMAKRDALQGNEFVQTEANAGQCEDSDWYYGWTDSYGDGCDWYYGNEEWCGYYDDGDFWANYDCCACGGGMFNYW